MLSILIPTYNAICLPLIDELHRQAASLGVDFEILLADDASDEIFRVENRRIKRLEECRYLQLDENVGPARIRNLLAFEARYRYLLFLDADTMPATATFLKRYFASAVEGGVVCGGFIYQRQEVLPQCALRYQYGINVEEMPAQARNKNPYHRFIGMSFLADREVFDSVRFDDTMHFGYEDAYFGKLLEEAQVKVVHIDNFVYHLNIDSSEAYLEKIRRSVCNLSQHTSKLVGYVRLLQWYATLRRFHFTSLVTFAFSITEKRLTENLLSPAPSMACFAFYKLGYLCRLLADKPLLR